MIGSRRLTAGFGTLRELVAAVRLTAASIQRMERELRDGERHLAALEAEVGRLASCDQRLDRLEQGLRESWATTADSLRRLEERVARTQQIAGQERAALDGLELRNVLWAIAAEEPATRRRLWELRESSDYEAAFTESDPLVTVVIPTRDRPELLGTRSVPSALSQTYSNVEVVVVGDAAGPAISETLRDLDDSRIRFRNLPHRVVATDEPEKHWLVAATMARNEGGRMARGRWIVSLDDDDAMHPDLVESLITVAREQRVEVAYGKLREVRQDGSEVELGAFPPRAGQFGWQAALQHSGLRLFERQFVAAEFGMAGDAYLLERMLRAGVRFGMSSRVVCDYFPSHA